MTICFQHQFLSSLERELQRNFSLFIHTAYELFNSLHAGKLCIYFCYLQIFFIKIKVFKKLFQVLYHQRVKQFGHTVTPVLSRHSKRTQKMVFNTNFCLMQVKSIAECSKGSILQYFRPSLSYHFTLRPLFCLFLRGRLTQVLLYCWA